MGQLDGVKLELVRTYDEVEEFFRWLSQRRTVLAIDTESGGLDWWRDRMRTVQFGDRDHGWTIPVEWWKGVAERALQLYEGPVVFQNLKYDLHVLEHNDLPVRRHMCHDSMVMAHLDDPTSAIGLKGWASRNIDPVAAVGEKVLHTAMVKNHWTWDTVPLEFPAYWQYAALDTVLTARMAEILWPRIQDRRSLYDTELTVSQILCDMESYGVRIDLEHSRAYAAWWRNRERQLRDWVRVTYDIDNATSDAQVIRRLALDGVELVKRTKSGNIELTDDVLKQVDHPLAEAVREIRKCAHFAGTYMESFVELAEDDILHASIRALGARTGRMSSSRPNLQNLPRRADVRDSFIARESNTLLLIDYDQIEYRIFAHYARDPGMIQAIRDGQDLHTFVAQRVYEDPTITKKDKRRQTAKNANFADVYGAGDAKFAVTAGISLDEATRFRLKQHTLFPGIKRFQNEVINRVRERNAIEGQGYVTSPFGRRHPVTLDKAYVAVNYLIQGTAADVLKVKMVELDKLGLMDRATLPVHDELVWDLPQEDAEEIEHEIIDVMQDDDLFSVPLTCEATITSRWGNKYREVA